VPIVALPLTQRRTRACVPHSVEKVEPPYRFSLDLTCSSSTLTTSLPHKGKTMAERPEPKPSKPSTSMRKKLSALRKKITSKDGAKVKPSNISAPSTLSRSRHGHGAYNTLSRSSTAAATGTDMRDTTACTVSAVQIPTALEGSNVARRAKRAGMILRCTVRAHDVLSLSVQ